MDRVKHLLEEPLTRAVHYLLSVLAKQSAELVVYKFNVNLVCLLLLEDGIGSVGRIKQLRHITLLVTLFLLLFFCCRRLLLVSENDDIIVQVL